MKKSLLLLVAIATLPASFALPANEFPIGPLPIGLAPHERRNVQVATNGEMSLAVWEDGRVPEKPRLWAARISGGGVVLDATGFVVAPLPPDSTLGTHLRAVAGDGHDFLVAWVQQQSLMLAKVTAEGVVTRPDANLGVDQVSMTFAGSAYAVFVTDPRVTPLPSSSVALAFFDRDGRPLGTPAAAVYSSAVLAIDSTLGSGGNNLFLAWSDVADGAVHASSYSAAAAESGIVTAPPAVVPVSPTPQAPPLLRLASNGTQMLAVWLDVQSVPNSYRVGRFDQSGAPIGVPVAVADAPEQATAPGVIWDGGRYVVVFQGADRALRMVRFAADQTPLDATPVLLADSVLDLDIASLLNGETGTIAWTENLAAPQVNADFLSPGLGLPRLAPGHAVLSASLADRSNAEMVWAGDHYLGAWRDLSSFSRAVIGRFAVDGRSLDGTGINVSVGVSVSPPTLASNGSTAVVAWLDAEGVSVSFIDEAGTVSGRAFRFPSDGRPAVHWNGSQYLAVWTTPQGQLVGLRLGPGGNLIDLQPNSIAPMRSSPLLAWTGSAYVAVSTGSECFLLPCLPPPIVAQFFTPALTPIGGQIALSDSTDRQPAVAESSAGVLVVWPRTVNGTTTLRAARIINGQRVDPLNGFEIGAGADATAHGSKSGWTVVSGPYTWSVDRSGTVGARTTSYPFVPAGAHSAVVFGGPAPLVVYRREPVGNEQMMQVLARYVSPPRQRAVKH